MTIEKNIYILTFKEICLLSILIITLIIISYYILNFYIQKQKIRDKENYNPEWMDYKKWRDTI